MARSMTEWRRGILLSTCHRAAIESAQGRWSCFADSRLCSRPVAAPPDVSLGSLPSSQDGLHVTVHRATHKSPH